MRKREQFRALRKAFEARDYLLKNPDVLGYGVGYRERGGKRTDEPALIVYVRRGRKRKAKTRYPRHRQIPERIRWTVNRKRVWLPVDLVEIDEHKVQATASSVPVISGVSIGNRKVPDNSGTIGWLARRNNLPVLCGCYHVLLELPAHSSTPNLLYDASVNGPEFATMPSVEDGGDPNNSVAAGILRGRRDHLLDIAIAGPIPIARPVLPQVFSIGQMGPRREITPADTQREPPLGVQIHGRTSRHQTGVLAEYPTKLAMRYSDLSARLIVVDLIATTIRTQGGDSGALLLDESVRPMGMLLGGAGSRSYFMHIRNIRSAMQLTDL